MRSVFSALTASLFAVSSKANLSDSGVGKFDLKSLDLGGALDLDKLKGFDLSGGLFGVGKKEGKGEPDLEVGLEVEEFRLNFALDIPAIDLLLEEGGTFVDSTAVPLNFQYEADGIPYIVKSIEYVGSGCPPQNTTGTVPGFDVNEGVIFSVNNETGPMLECPDKEGGGGKKGKGKTEGPAGDSVVCFTRSILEYDVGSCDGSTVVITDAPGVSAGFANPDTGEFREGKFISNVGGVIAYVIDGKIITRDGFQQVRGFELGGGSDGGGTALAYGLKKDAAGGCVDGKIDATFYTAELVGFQSTPECLPGDKASVTNADFRVNYLDI
uniref:Uncharacterized protein n=1 Tax=Chromera velia CCMP2878 TaxID=1169474 RepID=A0A0G4GXG0_9ALVE|mmetsp:Transcript_3631/g.7505  ORF Transcript_3631/g.7505 Transcript_3631/m.7505 type:complete len:326 (-) Transcript_3631:145-1122(-)|eukprot:Cvel_23769.t1-p1 / transcript=Cvel_23769.t1 / gene=Cvel_23769 / organism=Chromera_velia_CCMP2878 / gene_product=hypothetical protein / transcript_product=hypothetical protein / location=Cvel_scaffold2492:8941-9915(+) / protein_length=325 / sequence_SO=supercontig / SO=protein_coding / is_pseudo=false